MLHRLIVSLLALLAVGVAQVEQEGAVATVHSNFRINKCLYVNQNSSHGPGKPVNMCVCSLSESLLGQIRKTFPPVQVTTEDSEIGYWQTKGEHRSAPC